MGTAIIYFSDRSTLEVKEGDLLIPIFRSGDATSSFASMGEPVEIWNHTSNGLIPSLLDIFTQSSFFYMNGDSSSVYNSGAIVKISIV